MKEICKGCNLDVLAHIECAFVSFNQESKCPCTECLVKPMCSSPCDTRHDAKISIYRGHGHE